MNFGSYSYGSGPPFRPAPPRVNHSDTYQHMPLTNVLSLELVIIEVKDQHRCQCDFNVYNV